MFCLSLHPTRREQEHGHLALKSDIDMDDLHYGGCRTTRKAAFPPQTALASWTKEEDDNEETALVAKKISESSDDELFQTDEHVAEVIKITSNFGSPVGRPHVVAQLLAES